MRQQFNGLLILDKPGGITSRDAVNQSARWFPRGTKIGHAGTLDPLATGVLVLCVGRATRLVEYVQEMGKIYRSTFTLGARSDSDDADGAITQVEGAQPIDEKIVREALGEFIGKVPQAPPAYSAVKVDGRRAHHLARRGGTFEIAARLVEFTAINVLSYTWPELRVEVDCGKGAYIRALARDLGEKLGCGALVRELTRLRIGPFTVEKAFRLDDPLDRVRAGLLPMAAALAYLPQVKVNGKEREILRHGQPIHPPNDSLLAIGGQAAVLNEEGDLVGVAVRKADGLLWPAKTLAAFEPI